MTYPVPFTRLVASGSLFTEQFAFSLNMVGTAPTTPPGIVPEGVVDLTRAFFAATMQQAAARLTMVKFNRIGTDGRYSESTTRAADLGPAPVIGTQSTKYPPQVALAVSLDTGYSRGLAARGRFYLPPPGAAVQVDGRLREDDTQVIANAAAAYLSGLNDLGLGVVSIVSDVGAGAVRQVRTVRVGRALDTIRSRRTSIPEGYGASVDVEGTFGEGAVGGGF